LTTGQLPPHRIDQRGKRGRGEKKKDHDAPLDVGGERLLLPIKKNPEKKTEEEEGVNPGVKYRSSRKRKKRRLETLKTGEIKGIVPLGKEKK